MLCEKITLRRQNRSHFCRNKCLQLLKRSIEALTTNLVFPAAERVANLQLLRREALLSLQCLFWLKSSHKDTRTHTQTYSWTHRHTHTHTHTHTNSQSQYLFKHAPGGIITLRSGCVLLPMGTARDTHFPIPSLAGLILHDQVVGYLQLQRNTFCLAACKCTKVIQKDGKLSESCGVQRCVHL